MDGISWATVIMLLATITSEDIENKEEDDVKPSNVNSQLEAFGF